MSKIVFFLFSFISLGAFASYEISFVELEKHDKKIEKLHNQVDDTRAEGLIDIFSSLSNSIDTFSAYNSKELEIITELSSGDHPVYGNELTYISKSFSVYNRYYKLLKKMRTKSIFINDKVEQDLLHLSIAMKKREMFFKNYYSILGNQQIRAAINEDDLTYGVKVNEFRSIVRSILGRREFIRIKKLKSRMLDLKEIKSIKPAVKVMIEDLKRNKALSEIEAVRYKESSMRADKKAMNKLFRKDTGLKIKRYLTHHVSGSIGNLLGAVRWRKGRLLNNETIIQEVLKQLKPLDIITEKTWFAATDTFIPGHFGHNAIWLGTKEQLIENGMWDHPSIIGLQKQIERGKSIIESDRTGTHLKDIREFMNVDEFGILKIKGLESKSKTYIENLYKIATGQLGKKYDFNFDVETTDKLVCSELLYQSFGDIRWPTEVYLGRYTISPDNIASLSLYENSPVELTYYVAQVKKDSSELKYKNLDDLAKDIGFKKIDGKYFGVSEKCVGKKKNKVCTEELKELIYNP